MADKPVVNLYTDVVAGFCQMGPGDGGLFSTEQAAEDNDAVCALATVNGEIFLTSLKDIDVYVGAGAGINAYHGLTEATSSPNFYAFQVGGSAAFDFRKFLGNDGKLRVFPRATIKAGPQFIPSDMPNVAGQNITPTEDQINNRVGFFVQGALAVVGYDAGAFTIDLTAIYQTQNTKDAVNYSDIIDPAQREQAEALGYGNGVNLPLNEFLLGLTVTAGDILDARYVCSTTLSDLEPKPEKISAQRLTLAKAIKEFEDVYGPQKSRLIDVRLNNLRQGIAAKTKSEDHSFKAEFARLVATATFTSNEDRIASLEKAKKENPARIEKLNAEIELLKKSSGELTVLAKDYRKKMDEIDKKLKEPDADKAALNKEKEEYRSKAMLYETQAAIKGPTGDRKKKTELEQKLTKLTAEREALTKELSGVDEQITKLRQETRVNTKVLGEKADTAFAAYEKAFGEWRDLHDQTSGGIKSLEDSIKELDGKTDEPSNTARAAYQARLQAAKGAQLADPAQEKVRQAELTTKEAQKAKETSEAQEEAVRLRLVAHRSEIVEGVEAFFKITPPAVTKAPTQRELNALSETEKCARLEAYEKALIGENGRIDATIILLDGRKSAIDSELGKTEGKDTMKTSIIGLMGQTLPEMRFENNRPNEADMVAIEAAVKKAVETGTPILPGSPEFQAAFKMKKGKSDFLQGKDAQLWIHEYIQAAQNPWGPEALRGYPESKYTPEQIATAKHDVQIILTDPNLPIEVEGHTDQNGEPAANDPLSLRRARVVAAMLIMAMPELAGKITPKGWGESKPLMDGCTGNGKDNLACFINRRVVAGVDMRNVDLEALRAKGFGTPPKKP